MFAHFVIRFDAHNAKKQSKQRCKHGKYLRENYMAF